MSGSCRRLLPLLALLLACATAHAAVPGGCTRVLGSEFAIEKPKLNECPRNITAGCPPRCKTGIQRVRRCCRSWLIVCYAFMVCFQLCAVRVACFQHYPEAQALLQKLYTLQPPLPPALATLLQLGYQCVSSIATKAWA